jgi:phytoene synthase
MRDPGDELVRRSGAAIARGSSSFRLASWLFAPHIRAHVWQLYAWCRHCDDAIDGQDAGQEMAVPAPDEQRARLAELRRLTEAALAGAPVEDAAFRALQGVAREHRIDARWPLELLAHFELDVDQVRYVTVADTLAYCWGVAGVVGVMMALVMGARDAPVLRRAQDLGIAFQLTNICRDVAADARAGRVYLPASLLVPRGLPVTAPALLDPAHAPAVFDVTRELLTCAEHYYESSRAGLRDLPLRSAVAVAAARGIYREIGRRILARGPAALAERVTVPTPVKLRLLVRGLCVALWSRIERLAPRAERPLLWTRV